MTTPQTWGRMRLVRSRVRGTRLVVWYPRDSGERYVQWRPKLRCYDAIVVINPGPMNRAMATAKKLRTGSLLDACAFVLSPQTMLLKGHDYIKPGPPPDAVPPENGITTGNDRPEWAQSMAAGEVLGIH